MDSKQKIVAAEWTINRLNMEIEQLQAENEKLRESLNEINRDCSCCPALGEKCKEDGGNISACYRQKMIAKQALKETE